MWRKSSRLGLEAAETPWKTRWQDLVAEELAAVHEVGPVEASDGPWVTLGQVLGGKPRLQTSVAGEDRTGPWAAEAAADWG